MAEFLSGGFVYYVSALLFYFIIIKRLDWQRREITRLHNMLSETLFFVTGMATGQDPDEIKRVHKELNAKVRDFIVTEEMALRQRKWWQFWKPRRLKGSLVLGRDKVERNDE